MTEDRIPHTEQAFGLKTTLAAPAGGAAAHTDTASTGERKPSPQRRGSFGKWFGATGWRHLIAIAVSIFAVFPILYVVSASLNPHGTLTGTNQLFSSISFGIVLKNPYIRYVFTPSAPPR